MGTVCTDLKKLDIKQAIANGETKLRAFSFTKMLKKSRVSTVWLAKNMKLKTFCAVKITKKVQARKKNCIQTAINEQTILQTINHPLIVNAIGTFQDLSNLYIVLEYMPYGSLRDYMNISGTLTQSQVRFVMICILISLEYLHKHYIAHLDIKPQNILIDQFGYFRLCDFNLSIDFNKKDKKTVLSGTGTYGYQAPQIYQDETLIGISSDLYSIGVVGVQMLTGFRRRNSKPYATQYLKDLLKERKNVSQDCISFISRLLEDLPSNRIGAGGNFDHIWRHPWLYVCPTQKLQYQTKSIPSFIHDQYRKYIAEYTKQNSPRSSSSDDQENDQLLNKAMLEDKRFQRLFLNFRTIEERASLL